MPPDGDRAAEGRPGANRIAQQLRGAPLQFLAGVLVGIAGMVAIGHRPVQVVVAEAPGSGSVATAPAAPGSTSPAGAPAAPSDAVAGGGAATEVATSPPIGDGAAGGTATTGGPGPDGGDTPAPESPGGEPQEPSGDAPATSEPTRQPSRDVRGVTPDRIRIGVAVADHGPVRHLSPAFDNGDPREQWEAMVEDWRRRGLDVVHDRTMEFVYRSYLVTEPASERAACQGFVQDDKVLMVVGINYFPAGSACVAGEMRTPLLTADSQLESSLETGHPFLFSLAMSSNRGVRNMVHMGHHEGILPGRTIGVYHLNSPSETALVQEDLRGALESLGYEIAVVHATDSSRGGPQDAVAVQRFRSAGVDLALLFTSKAGFMQQADAQDYHPTYLESDYLVGTSSATTSTYPPEQFDGTFALTGRREGEVNAGMPLDDLRRTCLENFRRHTGREPERERFEWDNVQIVCDEGDALLRALQAAGPDLTPESVVAGFETIQDLPMRMFMPVTFRPDKHHGSEAWRKLQWHGDCRCWHAVGEVRPLFVP